jgi:hypothetical protein
MHAHMNGAALVLLALMIPLSLLVAGPSLAAAESVTGHADSPPARPEARVRYSWWLSPFVLAERYPAQGR